VISTHRIRLLALSAFSALALVWPGALFAQGQGQSPTQGQFPSTNARASGWGSYLAARHASTERDAAAAASYFRSALRADPRNNELLNRAFLAVLVNGEVDEAVRLAERVVQADRNDRIARLVLGVRALKQKQYPAARQQLAQSIRGPITDLAATLLSSWSQATAAESKAAIDAIDKLTGPEWYNIFKSLHAGLILDQTGQKREAGKRFERAKELDPNQLRTVQAYASYLSRQGTKEESLKTLMDFDAVLPRHPIISEAILDVQDGKRLAPLVDSPQTGAAEVLFGLGAALGRRGGEDLGLVYLQLAIYLAPNHPLALLSLADLYESVKKPELAIKAYEKVPASSPLRRTAMIQRAVDLDSLDRSEEAKVSLNKLIADEPTDLEAIMALGNILRGRKDFAGCADVYSKGVSNVARPDKGHWTLFYYRGICNERAKQWEKAEADFQKALEVFPDQPHVLNYLGYSWVDQGTRLDEGMRMVRSAVDQRPDDGYIVDSLGWAFFRIGNFDEAVKHLERAVELKPEDPTINDHLGDAYWKVGRVLEARFQWAHARDLKPEDPADLAKIEGKLKSGMPDDIAPAADADKAKTPGGG